MVLPKAHKKRHREDDTGLGRREQRLLADHAAAMQKAARLGILAGSATSVLYKGREVFRRTFGCADLENKIPFRHDTICRVYCMSKAYMNFTAMMLVEAGLLNLDAPVSDYIPSMRRMRVMRQNDQVSQPARTVMCVRHLITHSSGISYGAGFRLPPTETERRYQGVVEGVERGRICSLAQFVDEIAKVPLFFEPGERYEYGFSTDVLGRVLEVASGTCLETVLKERLFKPLGMHDTSFKVLKTELHRLGAIYGSAETWGHLHDGQKSAVPVVSKPGLVRIDGTAPEQSAWAHGKVRVYAGGGFCGHNRGGLVSTANDTLAFVRMLREGGKTPDGQQLLPKATIKQMEQNKLVGAWKVEGTRWSLLGDIVNGVLQQGGAAGNYWSLDRRRDLGIVVFMQMVDGDSWEDTVIGPTKGDIDQVMRNLVDKLHRRKKKALLKTKHRPPKAFKKAQKVTRSGSLTSFGRSGSTRSLGGHSPSKRSASLSHRGSFGRGSSFNSV